MFAANAELLSEAGQMQRQPQSQAVVGPSDGMKYTPLNTEDYKATAMLQVQQALQQEISTTGTVQAINAALHKNAEAAPHRAHDSPDLQA